MRTLFRSSNLRIATFMFLLLSLSTPLLHANDLIICKGSDSTLLNGKVFTFDVSGGTLTSTIKVPVTVGSCVDVRRGANQVYTITEEDFTDSILTNVTATGSNNGTPVKPYSIFGSFRTAQ